MFKKEHSKNILNKNPKTIISNSLSFDSVEKNRQAEEQIQDSVRI